MPYNKDLKRLVRARMAETGENYTQALSVVLSTPGLEPVPAPWRVSGTHQVNYRAGLLPAPTTYHGSRVVRLRLREGVADPVGFGTLMQSISASRYTDHRVRFAAVLRTTEVSDWAGLWLRVDTASGAHDIDNMHDRSLTQTTEWQPAWVVLDVPPEATSLHFGVLLSGAGAVDLAQPRFEIVGADVPVTAKPSPPLPEEPQALNFGLPARVDLGPEVLVVQFLDLAERMLAQRRKAASGGILPRLGGVPRARDHSGHARLLGDPAQRRLSARRRPGDVGGEGTGLGHDRRELGGGLHPGRVVDPGERLADVERLAVPVVVPVVV
jgi:hypothetical protein